MSDFYMMSGQNPVNLNLVLEIELTDRKKYNSGDDYLFKPTGMDYLIKFRTERGTEVNWIFETEDEREEAYGDLISHITNNLLRKNQLK